jgi:hypothetical protein
MDNPRNHDVAQGAPPQNGVVSSGYQHGDADTHAIFRFMVILGVALIAIAGFMWLWFYYLSIAERQPAPASPFAGVRQVPPSPQLQVNPRDDLRKSLAQQEQDLETYSWANRETGAVRIPIERAMDLLLQKGLPVVNPSDGSKPGSAAQPTGPDGAAAGARPSRAAAAAGPRNSRTPATPGGK